MKKILVLFLFFVVFSAIFQNGCSLQVPNTSGQDMLDAIARPDMNGTERRVDHWYLFHDDRIYAYLFDLYGKGEDVFLSTDLNGKDMKIISQSDDLRFAELYFIYDGYVYYYTTFHQGVKKINIETGEIFDVVDDIYLYLIPETLKDGKVIVEYENDYVDESHVYIATLDLGSGTLSDEKILPYFSFSYYYSAENNKVYFVGFDSDNNACLYEDNSVIYTYPSDVNANDFVFVQDHYIFLITSKKIIKLDILTHAIIAEKNFPNSGYSLYPSILARTHEVITKHELTAPVCVLENPLFRSKNNAVNQFNAQTMEFTEIANIDKANYTFIQKSNQHLILTNLETTTIYDENTGEASSFASCNFGADDKNIYLMTFDGDFYSFDDQACIFKVEKITQ